MNRNYIKPDMKITAFEVEDIITDSGMAVLNISSDGNMNDADAELYQLYSEASSSPSSNVSVFRW